MTYSKSRVARLIRKSDGAPTDLAAGTGALCSDTTNGALYINAGDSSDPDWVAVAGSTPDASEVAAEAISPGTATDVQGILEELAARATPDASEVAAEAISPGTASDVQGILEELAARPTPDASEVAAEAISPGTATDVQGILEELAARPTPDASEVAAEAI